eukprot:TRINITY_DN27840_c0_g1_i1.p1 TRINITY_DN27840_c0_g1~~TRINITY_DN27840_c0_g1_i1.p1  ORF type:complete len:139 (-),score=18.75 TRINITY_DN27840_c0_g1_i1:44-460(-)
MSKSKRPKETVQYTPPTPQVFGNSMPSDMPTFAPQSSSSFDVDRPRHRPKLQDRLAVYEDDNPRCQKILCVGGIIFPPFWLIGAILYATTPATKAITREAGFKNLVLTIIALVVLALYVLYHIFGGAAPTPPAPPAAG